MYVKPYAVEGPPLPVPSPLGGPWREPSDNFYVLFAIFRHPGVLFHVIWTLWAMFFRFRFPSRFRAGRSDQLGRFSRRTVLLLCLLFCVLLCVLLCVFPCVFRCLLLLFVLLFMLLCLLLCLVRLLSLSLLF